MVLVNEKEKSCSVSDGNILFQRLKYSEHNILCQLNSLRSTKPKWLRLISDSSFFKHELPASYEEVFFLSNFIL